VTPSLMATVFLFVSL